MNENETENSFPQTVEYPNPSTPLFHSVNRPIHDMSVLFCPILWPSPFHSLLLLLLFFQTKTTPSLCTFKRNPKLMRIQDTQSTKDKVTPNSGKQKKNRTNQPTCFTLLFSPLSDSNPLPNPPSPWLSFLSNQKLKKKKQFTSTIMVMDSSECLFVCFSLEDNEKDKGIQSNIVHKPNSL